MDHAYVADFLTLTKLMWIPLFSLMTLGFGRILSLNQYISEHWMTEGVQIHKLCSCVVEKYLNMYAWLIMQATNILKAWKFANAPTSIPLCFRPSSMLMAKSMRWNIPNNNNNNNKLYWIAEQFTSMWKSTCRNLNLCLISWAQSKYLTKCLARKSIWEKKKFI